jgi:hypothetical protein
MKRNIYKILLCGSIVASMLTSCYDILEEQPRAAMTPDLFRSEAGLQQGLTAAYVGLRSIAGAQGPLFCMELGTDEFTSGASNTNFPIDMTRSRTGTTPITSTSGDFDAFWNNSFQYINTCNGVIDFGTELNMSPVIIAEARFLRAYYYFNLVQMFGATPLDLGSGPLKFNTSPNRGSVRNSVDEVYAAIKADLQFAIDNLPVTSRLTGTVAKKAAIHYLAKVYLTTGEYALALSTAETLINNPGSYDTGLMDTYADVVKQGNEHGKEVLFVVEHTQDLAFNGFIGQSNADGGPTSGYGAEDRSNSYYTSNYPTFAVGTQFPVGRSVEYSRPWIRMAPTDELLLQTFADKTNDSRYYSTFQTVWLSNVERPGGANGSFTGLLGQPINVGDTALYFPGTNVSEEFKASKNYRVWGVSDHTEIYFPSMWKFFDRERKTVNAASGRPFIVAKLSETYLIAAEAAIKSGTQNEKARQYILALRRRAAFPGHEAEMEANTPATITIDYILDERSRELCGEQLRWLDLIRTGKWIERSTTYHLGGVAYTRTIEPHYVLRPIPQGQLDRLEESVDRTQYQNPGY